MQLTPDTTRRPNVYKSAVCAYAVVLAVALTAFCWLGCGSKEPAARIPPEILDLSGSWTLNAAESDDPSQVLQDMRSQGERAGMQPQGRRPSGGGPPSGMGGRRPSGGARPGGVAAETQQQAMQRTRQLIQRSRMRLVVSQDDSTLTLVYGRGDSLRIDANGRKLEQDLGEDFKIENKGEWKGREFVLERRVENGGKITEKYFLSPERDRLHVISSVELGRMPRPFEFHRVYDRVP